MSAQQQRTVMVDRNDYLPVGGREVPELTSGGSSGGAFTSGAAVESWPRPADEPFGVTRHGILLTGGGTRRAPAAPLAAAPRHCSGRSAVRLRMDMDAVRLRMDMDMDMDADADAAGVSSPGTRSAETVRIGEDEG